MTSYSKSIEIRWSDIDPLFHVRHSCYYDYGGYCRLAFMNEYGITAPIMLEYHIGPVVFREECLFKNEIRFGDSVKVDLLMEKLSPDSRKWKIKNQIWTNDTTLAAEITVDGAWLDTQARKIIAPPALFANCFDAIPKSKV